MRKIISDGAARRRVAMLLGAGMLACPVVTRGTTYLWTGLNSGTGYIDNPNNWTASPGAPPLSGPSDLVFGANGHSNQPYLEFNYNLSSITFNSSAPAYTMGTSQSNTITLITGGAAVGIFDNSSAAEAINVPLILGTSANWNVTAGSFTQGAAVNLNTSLLSVNTTVATTTATCSGTISGSGAAGIIKTGTGTMNLTAIGSSFSSLSLQGGTTQVSSGSLTISSALAGVSLTGSSILNISGGAVVKSYAPNEEDLIIGGNSSALITGMGSQFNSSGYEVAVGNSTPGSLTVASNGSLALSNVLSIGSGSAGGTGTLIVNSGGTVIAPQTVLSIDPGVTGSATVNGSGSTLTAATELDLGGYAGVSYGTGILTITNGGKVNATVTQFFTSSSSINISGGTLNTGSLGGTSAGTGVITLTSNPAGGCALNLNASLGTNTYFGTFAGSGTLNKSGGSTQILAANNTFTGQVIVGGGTLVETGLTDLEAGGVLNISGGAFSTYGLTGSGGSIKLTDPSGGAALTIYDVGVFGFSTTSSISGTGGVLKIGPGYEGLLGANTFTGQVLVNAGVLEMPSGTASAYNAAGGTIILDSGVSNANGSTGAGGILTGLGAFANVTINAGGTFAPGASYTGNSQNGSGGVITINALSTAGSNANLTLNVPTTINLVTSTDKLTLGGVISGTNGSLTQTGMGTLLLDGTGYSQSQSLSIQTGTTQIVAGGLTLTAASNPLSVQSTATLKISGGGLLSATSNLSTSYVDANSTINVTDPLSELNTYNLIVGNASQGTLGVTSQAILSVSQLLTIGSASGSNGIFTLTNGATASSPDVTIAKSNGASGSATVDGTGSVLTISGPGGLKIAGSSTSATGSVSITNGGAISCNSAVTFAGPDSSLIVNGGTLVTGSLTSSVTGYGAISLTDPAGGYALTLNRTNGTSTYSGSISGTGSIYKTGGGTQILSGANTFTGAVYVEGGSLNMSGGTAYLYQVDGGSLVLGATALGSSVVYAGYGTSVTYGGPTLSGGYLDGAGTHDISAVTSIVGTTIDSGVVLTASAAAGTTLRAVTSAGTIINPASNTLLWYGGSNAGGNVNISGSAAVSQWTSSGILNVNAGGIIYDELTPMVLLGGSRTYVGTSAAPGGTINLSDGQTIELNGGLLVNYGTITAGTVDVNYGGLATGIGSYGSVVVNPGGTYLPGNYGVGSPAVVLGSPLAMIQPAATGSTSTATPVTVTTGAIITVNPGSSLTLAGGLNASGQSVTLLGGGTAIVAPFPATSLNVSSGLLQLSPSSAVLEIASLTIGALSKLDLTSDSADISGGTLSAINALAKQGFANGTWNGAGGITSSTAAADSKHLTAIGVIQNNQGGTAIYNSSHQFLSTTPGASDILAAYTYYGDANLDGKVDGSDYSRIDAAYLADKTNPTAMTGWFNGDFNYDGVVNGSDYTLIDNAFNTQGAHLSAEIATPTAQLTGSTENSVPEPAGLALIVIGTISSLGRRRQRRASFGSAKQPQ